MNSNDDFENMRLINEKLNNFFDSPMSKILEEQQRMTRELVEPLNFINESQQQIRSIQDMISPSMTDLFKTQQMISESLQPIFTLPQEYSSIFAPFDSINQVIRDSFGTVSEIIERAKEDFEEYNKLMIKYNFPPHQDMDTRSFKNIAEFSIDHNENEIRNEIESIILNNYTDDMIKLYLENWGNVDWLKTRLPILTEAINNYIEKRYYSVVTCILPMFEGIIIEKNIHNIDGYVSHKKLVSLAHKIFDKEGSFTMDEASKTFYLECVLDSFKHGQIINSPLSRHAILHGADTNYGNKINALRCILFFDYLIFKLNPVNFEEYHK